MAALLLSVIRSPFAAVSSSRCLMHFRARRFMSPCDHARRMVASHDCAVAIGSP